MSIFGSIVSKIFGHANASPAPTPGVTTASAAPSPGAASVSVPPSVAPAPAPDSGTSAFNNPPAATPAPGGSAAPASAPAAPGGATASTQPVDVAEVLNDMLHKSGQKLDWQHSIVDLMKLLGLDSSLSARQELAKELDYSGSTSDSATMNIWLHKQVMQKLAANGGKVPDELRT